MIRAIAIAGMIAATGSAAEIRTTADSSSIPARFRLEPATFDVTVKPKFKLPHSGVEVFDVSFPSPVISAHVENNTVVGEFFLPLNAPEKLPAVIVLDIMDGAQAVSRGQAMWLAQHGVAALTVQMAYYGPRRPPGTKLRLVMPDIDHSVNAITQTVLDCRRAVAYLASRPDIDSERIGVLGTSLGSFVGGVVGGVEPKISRVCLLLGGGGLVDSFYDHPKGHSLRAAYELFGGSRDKLKAKINPIDPITYAEQLKTKKVTMFAARRDEVVPPKATKTLWEAAGKPPILWVDTTHVGGALHIFPAMAAAIETIKK